MNFGLALRYLRKQQGRRQTELADAVGVGQNYISALEGTRGRYTKPGSDQTRRALAQTLGWPYEGMLELGNLLAQGMDPEGAQRLAKARWVWTEPQPIVAQDLQGLTGFRVHLAGQPTARTVWADLASLGVGQAGSLQALETDEGDVVLVDTASRHFGDDCWFVITNTLRLRRAKAQSGAFLLTSLDGAVEAHAGPWEEICLGRALWVQKTFALADHA